MLNVEVFPAPEIICSRKGVRQHYDGITVKPPNKGHFDANCFVPCREVVPIAEVK